MVGVRVIAIARSAIKFLSGIMRPAVRRRKHLHNARREPREAHAPRAPVGGGHSSDLPRFLSSFDIMACDQITGMTSPALLHVEAGRIATYTRSPARLKEFAEAMDGFGARRKKKALHVEVAAAVAAIVIVAVFIKLAAVAPRTGPRTPWSQRLPEPVAVKLAATDVAGAIERRLDFAAGFNVSTKTYQAWVAEPAAQDFPELTPAGIPLQFLSNIMTGAVNAFDKNALRLDLPATIEPQAEEPTLSVPAPALVRKKSLVKNSSAVKHRRVKQAVQHAPPQLPAPLPEPALPAGSASLLFGELFTPAEGPPPAPEAAASAAPETAQGLGLFPVSPFEAEANRW